MSSLTAYRGTGSSLLLYRSAGERHFQSPLPGWQVWQIFQDFASCGRFITTDYLVHYIEILTWPVKCSLYKWFWQKICSMLNKCPTLPSIGGKNSIHPSIWHNESQHLSQRSTIFVTVREQGRFFALFWCVQRGAVCIGNCELFGRHLVAALPNYSLLLPIKGGQKESALILSLWNESSPST